MVLIKSRAFRILSLVFSLGLLSIPHHANAQMEARAFCYKKVMGVTVDSKTGIAPCELVMDRYGPGGSTCTRGYDNEIAKCIYDYERNKLAVPNKQDNPASLVLDNKSELELKRARDEAARVKAELELLKSKNQSSDQKSKPVQQPSHATVNPIPPSINSDTAFAINKRIADLTAQINVLEKVLFEQKELKKIDQLVNVQAIDATIASIQNKIQVLKSEFSERNSKFEIYLTSIKPNDKDLYLTSRKASEIYPKIPYYIAGTNETGEFWVEPFVTDRGEINFSFKFVDITSTIEKVRGKIDMNLEEMELSQKALFKLYSWSQTAHEEKIRKNYEKRVVCFPASECPADGERLDGKSSTEIRFTIYDDGSTSGKIQRNKGRFLEAYNLSIDSAMLLQAYLNHVVTEAKIEFKSGTQDKKSLDQLFK